jgi:hypothetical protein
MYQSAEDYVYARGLPPNFMPAWVFEDVKFIGMTSEISFNSDGAEIQQGTFPFVFKRLYRVDRQSVKKRAASPSAEDVGILSTMQNNQTYDNREGQGLLGDILSSIFKD